MGNEQGNGESGGRSRDGETRAQCNRGSLVREGEDITQLLLCSKVS